MKVEIKTIIRKISVETSKQDIESDEISEEKLIFCQQSRLCRFTSSDLLSSLTLPPRWSQAALITSVYYCYHHSAPMRERHTVKRVWRSCKI